MANELAQALAQSTQTTGGREGFRAGSGTGYQAARIRPEQTDNSLGDALRNFVRSGADAFGAYENKRQAEADARSNEIIRKLTPEQRREAIGNGTLLYMDDPDAMQQLRYKSGRNAAYEVDSEVQQEIQKGSFRTRQELEEYRQTRLEQKSQNYAQMAGINPDDKDYQSGFNSDINRRSAAVYDLHSQYLSKNLETQAVLETRADLQPILDDPKQLGNPSSADFFANYFNNGLKSGIFPSDAHAVKGVQLLASEAVNKEGGVQLLDSLGDKTINVYGGQRKIKDLIDPTVYEGLKVQAQNAAYTRDSKRTENVTLGIANAIHDADPASGWAKLNKLEQDNDWIQTGTQMTPIRQALINGKAQLISAVAQNSKAQAIQLQKNAQADNRQAVIDDAFTRRMAGQNVSVDPKFLPTNENTGEKFTDADMATYAAKKLNQIDAMEVPASKKAELKAALLRADYDKGPFQAAFKTLLTDASREWQGALLSPEPVTDTPRLKELQASYQQDPATIAQLFPEQAGLVEKLRYAAESGIEPQVLIDAEKSNKGISKDEQAARNLQWSSVKNDSRFKELKYLPNQFETQARQVYDAATLRTGDSTEAAKAVSDYMSHTAVSFVESNGSFSSDGFHGMVSKRDLMTDVNDVNSWQTGKTIIDDTMSYLKTLPEWSEGSLSVESSNGNLWITNPLGKRYRISKEAMGNLARDRAAQADQARFDSNVKDAQKAQKTRRDYITGGRGPL